MICGVRLKFGHFRLRWNIAFASNQYKSRATLFGRVRNFSVLSKIRNGICWRNVAPREIQIRCYILMISTSVTPTEISRPASWDGCVCVCATRRMVKKWTAAPLLPGNTPVVCLNWTIYVETEADGSWRKLTEAKIGQNRSENWNLS